MFVVDVAVAAVVVMQLRFMFCRWFIVVVDAAGPEVVRSDQNTLVEHSCGRLLLRLHMPVFLFSYLDLPQELKSAQ